jgi:hypothetical protein
MALMVRKCIQATAPIIMPTKHIRCMNVWWARKNCAHPARLPVLPPYLVAALWFLNYLVGVTLLDEVEAGPFPTLFLAVTVNV